MATAAPMSQERQMSIGRVFERAFSAIRTNPGVILGLALIIGALPNLLITYLIVQMGLGSPDNLANGGFSRLMGMVFISSLISLVISALVQGALTRATVSAAEGKQVTFGESLSTGLRVALPLIGLSIISGIAVALGFVLLIVPGIILLLMWSVAVSALVIERDGIFAALGRSAELSKGARWKILGLFLVLVVFYWLLSLVFSIVGLSTYTAGTGAVTGITTANLIGGVLVGTIFNAVWGTIQPSLYVELRQWKEGTSIESLAEVFA